MCPKRIATVPLVLLGAVAAAPVPKAGPVPPITEAHLATSKENVKKIGLGIIACADSNDGPMPTNIADKNGRALLSWRVAILPFIEQDRLDKEFKFDEPWDPEHNKKLIGKMPKVYAPVRVRASSGETFYQVFFGARAIFGPKQHPVYPASIADGTSGTALVFEAGEPVTWTKPTDLPFDEKKALPKLGGLFDGAFHVSLCDGSVILVKKDFDAGNLKKVIMPADASPTEIIDTLKK